MTYNTITEKFYQVRVNGEVKKEYPKCYLIECRGAVTSQRRRIYMALQAVKAAKLFPGANVTITVERRVYQAVTPVSNQAPAIQGQISLN